MSARTLAGNFSRIIGLIIRYPVMEGKNAVQDPFNSELIGTIEAEIRKAGFFLMLYASDNAQEVLNVAHTWNVDGLIAFGMGAKEFYRHIPDPSTPRYCMHSHRPKNNSR